VDNGIKIKKLVEGALRRMGRESELHKQANQRNFDHWSKYCEHRFNTGRVQLGINEIIFHCKRKKDDAEGQWLGWGCHMESCPFMVGGAMKVQKG